MSPLSLVEKDPGSGKWCMIHHLLKEDDEGESTNGGLNVDDFPTKYSSANMASDLVHDSHDACPSLGHPRLACTCILTQLVMTCHVSTYALS